MDVRDPVCGMRFNESQAATTFEYEGETYYFCTEACREAFKKDPGRFLGEEGEQ